MEALERFVAEQRELWEIPGCAVGVVHREELVWKAGFGTREFGTERPVSSETLFPIGSTTKSFTAAAVAALVDDCLVEWDKPVREYLPGFAMHDPVATERVTVRDLLAHRTGIPRHEFVWLGHPDRSRADLVRRLRYLAPSKDIRQSFQYSNLGYVTAGHLIEMVSGSTWEEFLGDRLLKPLGMDRSNFSVDETQNTGDFSQPHELRGGKVVRVPFRDMGQIGPAGGIVSCIDDMVAYLRAQIGIAGNDVVSHAALGETQAPQITIPEDRTFPESTRFAYGLGWLVGQYRGHRIVEHNGGVDGFLTDCLFLPDDGIGVVVLSNLWSAMGKPVAYRAFDELLGLDPIDWSGRLKAQWDAVFEAIRAKRQERPRVENAPLLRELHAYDGEYEHPGYGRFSVKVERGELVPTFGTLPLSLTHRHHDVFDLDLLELASEPFSAPVTFLTGPDGDVVALTVEFEDAVDPIRFDRVAPESGIT